MALGCNFDGDPEDACWAGAESGRGQGWGQAYRVWAGIGVTAVDWGYSGAGTQTGLCIGLGVGLGLGLEQDLQ